MEIAISCFYLMGCVISLHLVLRELMYSEYAGMIGKHREIKMVIAGSIAILIMTLCSWFSVLSFFASKKLLDRKGKEPYRVLNRKIVRLETPSVVAIIKKIDGRKLIHKFANVELQYIPEDTRSCSEEI